VHILWERLIRPDGVSIDLDSPAGDALGQTGVTGRVNNHTLAKIGSSILQTALTAGVTLAARGSQAPVILGLPGTIGAVAPQSTRAPVIRVRQGAEISVFVARDLVFAGTPSRQ
jgi:type IV secretion system protein VirB10